MATAWVFPLYFQPDSSNDNNSFYADCTISLLGEDVPWNADSPASVATVVRIYGDSTTTVNDFNSAIAAEAQAFASSLGLTVASGATYGFVADVLG